ncbi:MAG: acyl-CoA thioesterase II [Alteromonadaceae bacterium]|uniref:acyl-CoA thioesterase n=1 Tax=Marinobacter sp. BGYM27 TaxID=2975597 RepID=UPI000C55FCD8|nr:acyl-CoA thioesterase II [Marinobacter sp. BGYM27]MAA66841.1 acyl-CoA thioesterase II [Alteromonadaceae bacterium]MBH84916.1 acyl-CoA thioesterase II [Alteromonadaceae bacterium]MDG5501023.1 acyl-CoA thioesterase II [Marinobacter sp. BGYM27]|tara:strand:- start:6 stop:872 length:867 start_codon:yes stop_codon:yes gene_type:complete
MLDVTRKLVELLDLAPIGDDHFQGESEDLGFENVFGGQVLGQALMAASRTVENRTAHSLHAYFLRPGNTRLPIDYEVQRVRDGGTFSVRRVIARQDGKEILTGSMSFQVEEPGFDHQVPMPEVSSFDKLKSEHTYALMLKQYIPENRREKFTRDRPIEIRPIDPVNPLKPEPKDPQKQAWFRAQGDLPDDPVLHRCLLAYSSDFGLLGTSLHPHGVSFMNKGMQVASLDHSIWFHREFRMDDWLLYDKDSPSASGGRGFNRGNIFNREGVLVASTCQEALIRQRSAKS